MASDAAGDAVAGADWQAGRRAVAGRSAEAVLTFGRHGLRLLRPAHGSSRARQVSRELRDAFAHMGPTYIKLAQLISSSPGLFPEPLAAECRTLLDRVPALPYAVVRAVVASELGAFPEAAFASFAKEPLAAASIAQVHAATLHDGTEVVVKVQRPGLQDRMAADLRILHQLAALVDRYSAQARMANPRAVVADFAATLREELDFVVEARAMERFAANLTTSAVADRVRVPAVHWTLTTPRVLTMERIYGHRIDDLVALSPAGWDLAGVLKAGVRAWLEAALQHGFFHGDVHAGNLMLDSDGALVFLDFGITGQLDERTRTVLRSGLPALLVERDYAAVARAIYELGAVLEPLDVELASRDIARIVEPLLAKSLAEVSYGEVLVEIIRVGLGYGVRLPRELVLVAKQLLYFERYAKLLAPDWNLLADADLLGFLFGGVTPADIEPVP